MHSTALNCTYLVLYRLIRIKSLSPTTFQKRNEFISDRGVVNNSTEQSRATMRQENVTDFRRIVSYRHPLQTLEVRPSVFLPVLYNPLSLTINLRTSWDASWRHVTTTQATVPAASAAFTCRNDLDLTNFCASCCQRTDQTAGIYGRNGNNYVYTRVIVTRGESTNCTGCSLSVIVWSKGALPTKRVRRRHWVFVERCQQDGAVACVDSSPCRRWSPSSVDWSHTPSTTPSRRRRQRHWRRSTSRNK